MTTDKTVRRPLLRYFGGKWRLARRIIEHFPEHRVYTEVFGGGASILLRKPRAYHEVYNDLSGEITNLFEVVRDSGPTLKRMIQLTPYSRDEFMRAHELCDDPLEQARRTLILSFMGHGADALGRKWKTGFRAKAVRSHTTGAMDWAGWPTALGWIISRLRGVVIENRDAIEVLKQQDDPLALHYADPPYVHSTRQRTRGYQFEMADEKHVELAEVLRSMLGHVVLSGYRSTLYDELYAGWQRVEMPAMADGAEPRTEVLWIKRAAA